jgi:hypothetical protein
MSDEIFLKSQPDFLRVQEGNMHGRLSPRVSNTSKPWIVTAVIVYLALGAALLAEISWDLSHRNGLSRETAWGAEHSADRI